MENSPVVGRWALGLAFQVLLHALLHGLPAFLAVPPPQQVGAKLVGNFAQILAFVLRCLGQSRIRPDLLEQLQHFRPVEGLGKRKDALILERRVEHGGDDMNPGIVDDIDEPFCNLVSTAVPPQTCSAHLRGTIPGGKLPFFTMPGSIPPLAPDASMTLPQLTFGNTAFATKFGFSSFTNFHNAFSASILDAAYT